MLWPDEIYSALTFTGRDENSASIHDIVRCEGVSMSGTFVISVSKSSVAMMEEEVGLFKGRYFEVES